MKPSLRFFLIVTATFLYALPMHAKSVRPGEMNVVEINKYQLAGAEYWPFYGDEPFRYPNDVLWGFYPEGVSKEAVKCAEASYAVLLDFFRQNWRIMRDVVSYGATRKFYLWTNDYSYASSERLLRKAKLSHWNPGVRDYSQGYWKWESTLSPAGTCEIPNAEQINEVLSDALKIINR